MLVVGGLIGTAALLLALAPRSTRQLTRFDSGAGECDGLAPVPSGS
jgi:hypothetical protein